MHKTDFKQKTYFYKHSVSLSVHFSAEGTQFLFSSRSHFLLLSHLEKCSMFSQTVEIHLYNKATEGFR